MLTIHTLKMNKNNAQMPPHAGSIAKEKKWFIEKEDEYWI